MGSLFSCARSTTAAGSKRFSDKFQLGPELGKGHFATVNICTDRKSGEKFAVKIINKRKITNPMVMREEVAVLRRVGKHRHCVELVSVHEDDSNFYLIMELCTGGDLFSRIVDYGNYSEKDAGRTLQQLAMALDHIHKQGVTHRDLKPENLLLVSSMSDSDLKVGDFGLSKILDGDQVIMKTICGTWAYCAPEVIEQKPYTSLVDNWTLGVLMFILLSGYHPFDDFGDLPEPELLERIVNCDYSFDDPVWNDISEPPKQIIRSLLKLDPQQRLSLEAFLAHPWINGGIANAAPLTGTITRMQSFNSGRKGKTGLVSQYSTTMMDTEPSLESKANFATTIAKKRISEASAEGDGDSQGGAEKASVEVESAKETADGHGHVPGAGANHTVQFGSTNIIAEEHPNLEMEQLP